MDMKNLTRMLVLILAIWGINHSAQAQKKEELGFRVKASKQAVIGAP